ncbi:MAG: HlyD family efflux transporter periplasmic adaptor subunit [Clostridia bacterium]|nr:HlyD family efflux transporter periplasmic adaptor subunit [Clostridia bacterium]
MIILILLALASILMLGQSRGADYTEVILVNGDITTYYSFSGSVEAKNRQTIFADKIMQIAEVLVEEGQTIKKDDVLMRTTMGEKIKAKIDGEVSNIYIEENAQLMAGSKLMDIVDYNNLQLKVQVDEYDLPAVEKGKEVEVSIHALSKILPGKIDNVSKEGQYLNGLTLFTAIISINNDDTIRVGMSAEVRALNQSVENALILPMSAIQFDNNNNPYVFIDTDKGPQKAELELGINDGINVEIIRGITASDTILEIKKESSSDFDPVRMPGGMRGNSNNNTVGGSSR